MYQSVRCNERTSIESFHALSRAIENPTIGREGGRWRLADLQITPLSNVTLAYI